MTKHNFEQIFPQLEEDIKTCTFICEFVYVCISQYHVSIINDSIYFTLILISFNIAYDSEYTGLAVNESVQPSLFDTPDERYKKQKISASSVITCQVGLSIYKFDLIENKYVK